MEELNSLHSTDQGSNKDTITTVAAIITMLTVVVTEGTALIVAITAIIAKKKRRYLGYFLRN